MHASIRHTGAGPRATCCIGDQIAYTRRYYSNVRAARVQMENWLASLRAARFTTAWSSAKDAMIRQATSSSGPFQPLVRSKVACQATSSSAGVAPGSSKDAVQQQLQQLNLEAKELRSKLDTVRDALLANPDKQGLLLVLKGLQAEAAQLNQMRGDLQAQLSGLAQPIAAPAVAEDQEYTAFFQALCTAKEELLAEGDEDGPALLKLMADVIFPDLRSSKAKGQGNPPMLLVRKCWKEFRDLILQQGTTLVIGTPGIGKSVFAWWFVRHLAALGFAVVYRAEKAAESRLCKDGRVLAGPHSAFTYLQGDANTWWVFDALEPDVSLVSKSSRILVVSSPNRACYKDYEKAPGVIKMVMPRWSLEEIKLGLQHVYPPSKYPAMTTARVENLFMYYDGVPRFVLGKPSEVSGPAADHLDLRNSAVEACDAAQVLRGAVVCEAAAERYHRLLHLIPTSPDYRLWKTDYASRQAFLRVWQHADTKGASALQAYWQSGDGEMNGRILEEVTKTDLASRRTTYDDRRLLRWFGASTKTYTAQQQEQVESSSQCTTIKPGRELQFTFDNTRYAEQLESSWKQPGVWAGRTLLTPAGDKYPEVDCVMLPAPKAPKADGTMEQVELVELYQITVGKEKEVDCKILANILCALPDAKQYTLYFVVPKEMFHSFTVKPISSGTVSKEGQARLDRMETRVISNVEGLDALRSYDACSMLQL